MDVVNSLLRAARAGNLKRVLEIIEDELVDINVSNNNGLTALHSACKEGHTRIVEQLLVRGANVHARTLKGNQPIHIASLAGHEPVVRILLDNGADVNAQSTSGFTSLYMAAQENHESIVKLLLERGADQNISTTDGFTPLAVSLQQNHENIAKILLNHEARGQVRFPGVTDTGRSLLHVAAKKNDCAAAALLLQNNIRPDVTSKSNFTSLHVACHYGNEAVAKLLIDNGADVNFQAKQNITPLHVAARWNQLAMVNLLLDYGAVIDAQTKDHLTPLHCAARMGHDACVELLIQRGAPISAKTRSHLVPLHMSAQGNHLRSAQILLNNRAPVDDVTIDHLTSLHVASHCGHVKVAKLLLDYKANPNIRAQNGFTSLHIACKKNHLEIVKLLLKYGASLRAVTESGLSCLHIASFMGCVEIVVYLLDHDADIEAQTIRGETPLILATRSNQFEVIDVLLRCGANANACDQNHQNALHLSARLGNVKIAKLLIDRGVDIDAPTRQMYTALHIASKENHQNVVALLLENGAEISCATKNHEFFPLHLASKYGNDKIVELLLNYGAPVDARGKNDVTSLMVASHYDHPRVVELLLMFGASPHATAKNGYTAIHIAAKGNRIDCSNILLQNGADPNVESKAGFCPLHLASQEGRANMAALLLENGARVNCRAKNGITPLHLCAQEDHVSVAQLLVKYGAHLDAQTRNGFTPLHVACHFTRVRMIRFLLANGANVNVPAASGYTSLHQASQQGNPQIVDLLLQYNAKPDALTDNGHSALSIAENLGHVSVIDTLRIVTETVIKTTKTTITEERFKIIAPETMQETFISDSEDEADDTPAHQESVKFLTTDVMKSFNNTMAEENYNTSQSVLNVGNEQQAQLRRQRSQQSNEQLSASGGAPRTTRIADEMSQDLQYLSREAPLDGGESTFGAYSTLGGSQQHPADGGQSTTVTHQSTYKSTVTRTSSTQLGDDDALLLDEDEGGRHPSGGRLENDYERTDFRIDGDDDATQVYDYNQRASFGSNGNRDNVQGSFGDQQQQLEQLAPDNVDIQRPLQQAGSSQAMDTTEQPSPNDADQQEQQWQQREQERLAELSRVELEQGDLDNVLERVDEPIRLVDLAESERTMLNIVEVAADEREVSTGHQQEQNLQVVNSSSLPLKPFLVSFMVDARGGAMRGCRHSGVRVIIPPNTAPQPMRITCRYLRRERLVHPPPLMEGEACASKIMEVGPAGARFLGPVLIEVPHFASLRGKEREIIILRSDSGEVWREHLFDTDESLVDSIIGNAELVEQQQQQHYDQENQRPSSAIGQTSQIDGFGGGGGDANLQQEKRLTRIVTNEFPQYFAIISRVRQEVHTVGPDGLAVDSQVVPRVQAIFTDGALTKRIKIGLQKKNGAGSQPGSPEPQQQPGDQNEVKENVAGQERTRSPSSGRPGSAQAKRKSRFLACFGASYGSHDPLNQSGTDAEGFASGSNESSSSSAGGDSPRQLANEKLIERRHIIEDLTDSEAEDSLDGLGANKSKTTKKRSATGNELVPEDYYIEPEPAFILNVRPKTYGKRLASSSAQTDQKLQQNGFLTNSTRSPKRRGVNLLNVARRRRNKTQMQIPLHEPTAQIKSSQQQQQSRMRPKSADLGTSTADSSLESQHADERLDERLMIDGSILATEDDEADQKWRTCTIQTDSDSVTVQYVTLSSLSDAGAAVAAATAANKSTTATGQDDGYVSGSGELKRTAAADQTGVKTSHKSSHLFLPFCSSSSAAEDDDPADRKTSEVSEEADIKREKKRKSKSAKSKDSSGGLSGKASPVKLDVVVETKAEPDDKIKAAEQEQVDTALVVASQDQSEPQQQSGGEEADESLVTLTTTSRSISPTSKERKQQLKLEKQERLKREKLDRLKQKELDEANAKALKAQKKLEKEAKKRAEKEEKLAKRAAASSGSKQQSPSESRAQSPEQVAVSVQQQHGDELKTNDKSTGVLGAITKTIQSVKFAPSPSKDSPSDKSAPADNQTSETGRSSDKRVGDDEATATSNDDGSMVHVSIGTDSHLLSESEPRSGDLDRDENEAQLISFSSDPETISSTAAAKLSASGGEQPKVLKPILKQQSGSIEDSQAIASAELKIAEPKTLSSIADELITEATEEAVRAADVLQQAQISSGTSSPTLTSSASDSKKEAAKRLKAEKEKFKTELKSSSDEEKRLSKEAKRLAKQAEEAARKAEREAKRTALEAKEEAERQAEIAKREAQAALKLIEVQEDLAGGATSTTDEIKLDKSELKRRAKQAEAEAKRLAKAAEDEAKRLAKAAKKEAKEAAAQEKARLKAEKKQKSKLGVEPSAPSIDLISSSSPEMSKSSPQKEAKSEVFSEEDSKSVPIGLPRVSYEIERGEAKVKLVEPIEPEAAARAVDQAQQAASEEDAQPAAVGAEVAPEISDKSATEPVAESTTSDKKDKKANKSKQQKKYQKKKKRAASDKKNGDATSICSSASSSQGASLPAETVSKSSSFLGRLFRAKPKQQKQPKGADDQSAPLDSTSPKSNVKQQDQMLIVSEMYPSDPNNADGEMILEVNLPENLMGESQQAHFNSAAKEQSPEEKIESVVTSLVTSTTGQQAAEQTDDQEATLVNLSQMKDDVNDDEDDDEATENVLSQSNDLVEDHQHQHQELPTVAQGQGLGKPISGVEVEPSAATELEAAESRKIVPEPVTTEITIDKSGAEQQQMQVVSQEGATEAVEASIGPQVASSSQAAAELVKDEKARKELEAKLEKEAKKRAKEEEKARKKQEKEDKKRAELEAKKQAKEEKERKKREDKEAKKMAEMAKKEAKKNKQKAGSKATTTITSDTNPQDPTSGGTAENTAEHDQQQPTTITTTTITSTSTTAGDERTLNPNIGDQAGAGSGHVIMSTMSEVPINEETEVERIIEEVVGDDGTVTKTTKTVETKYVTMRQEEIRIAERRDMSVEEWERLQAERAEQQPSTSDGQFIERIKRQATPDTADYRSAELEEIRATPSYFDPTQTPPEIKPDTSEKKALKMRIRLNQKLIKKAKKLAKVESKKAKRDQRRAEAEIAVCDEAARQARKELKCAVKEAKRATKLTEKQHKKMDKIDKKLTKRANELEKRQKKIDKQLAKEAKKQAKKAEKAAKKAAKLERAGSSSSKSPSRSSKRSIRAEDIGEPVLRSSSRLSIVQNNPNVELSIQQPVEQARVSLQMEADQRPVAESADTAVVEASSDAQQYAQAIDGQLDEANQVVQMSASVPAEAETMRSELEASREEDEGMMIDVVGEPDEPVPVLSPSPEINSEETAVDENQSPQAPGAKGKKNKKRNKRQKSKESAE